MSIIDVRTVTCDGPNCNKAIAFPGETAKETVAGTPWMRGLRQISTSDGRNFCYCSTVCEIEGAGTGKHDPLEQKKIISIDEGKAALAMRQAQMAVEAAKQSDAALKNGTPITIEPR